MTIAAADMCVCVCECAVSLPALEVPPTDLDALGDEAEIEALINHYSKINKDKSR